MRLTWMLAFLAAAEAGSAPQRVGTEDNAAQTQQPPQQDQPPPTIRVGTEVVRVDVTVLDRRRRPLTDLTMGDFVVEEDGAAQTITSFKLVETGGEPAEGDTTSLAIRSRSHARQEAARDDVRLFLIFWDEYHIDQMASALRSREALTNFVLAAFGPTDLVAFMEPMTPLDAIEFTRDRRQLAERVRTLQGRRGIYVPPRNAAEEAHLSAMRDVERLRHEVTISAIKAAVVHLGAIRESRKDIIVVSQGFRGENDVMLDLIRAANSSNAAIHIVDPRGLMVGGARGMWMDSVASETGGQIYRRNDLNDAMHEVVAASRAYYLLGMPRAPRVRHGSRSRTPRPVVDPALASRPRLAPGRNGDSTTSADWHSPGRSRLPSPPGRRRSAAPAITRASSSSFKPHEAEGPRALRVSAAGPSRTGT